MDDKLPPTAAISFFGLPLSLFIASLHFLPMHEVVFTICEHDFDQIKKDEGWTEGVTKEDGKREGVVSQLPEINIQQPRVNDKGNEHSNKKNNKIRHVFPK